MSERPIIFSAPMVRALLDGRKTQTRRVLKAQPQAWAEAVEIAPYHSGGGSFGKPGSLIQRTRDDRRQHGCGRLPYVTGDRLWVREAYDKVASMPGAVFYRADYDAEHGASEGLGWAPSIHMPRWASRLTLTVTEVRVQRLQDISEEDAKAEGAGLFVPGHGFITEADLRADPGYSNFLAPRMGFEAIWSGLHGPGAWDANQWVAAITFTVHRGNIDAIWSA